VDGNFGNFGVYQVFNSSFVRLLLLSAWESSLCSLSTFSTFFLVLPGRYLRLLGLGRETGVMFYGHTTHIPLPEIWFQRYDGMNLPPFFQVQSDMVAYFSLHFFGTRDWD